MKNKESISIWIIKHLYGVSGVLDERKRQEIGRIASNAYFILLVCNLLSAVIAGFIADQSIEKAFEFLFFAVLLGSFFLVNLYVFYATTKLHLIDREVEARDYPNAIKKSVWRAIEFGIGFGLLMYLINVIFDWSDGIQLTSAATSMTYIVRSTGAGIVMGIVHFLNDLFKIKKYRE